MASGNFASARIEKLMRNAGAERVSQDAINKLNEVLTEKGLEIAKAAVEFARHGGRKTVKGDDVKLAASR
ncbi:MAG: histone [Candidatus Hodarchaeales archaeon]|jgi:histone H3/H4